VTGPSNWQVRHTFFVNDARIESANPNALLSQTQNFCSLPGNKRNPRTGLISGRLGHFRLLAIPKSCRTKLKERTEPGPPTWTPELGAPDVSLNFMTPLHIFRWSMIAALAALFPVTAPAVTGHMMAGSVAGELRHVSMGHGFGFRHDGRFFGREDRFFFRHHRHHFFVD